MQLAAKESGPWLLMATDQGVGKRMALSELRLLSRGAQGVICCKLADGETLVSVHVVDKSEEAENEDCLLATNNGMVTRTPVSGFKLQGRISRGVRVMRLQTGDKLSHVTPCRYQHVSAVTESGAE